MDRCSILSIVAGSVGAFVVLIDGKERDALGGADRISPFLEERDVDIADVEVEETEGVGDDIKKDKAGDDDGDKEEADDEAGREEKEDSEEEIEEGISVQLKPEALSLLLVDDRSEELTGRAVDSPVSGLEDVGSELDCLLFFPELRRPFPEDWAIGKTESPERFPLVSSSKTRSRFE